MLGTGSFDRMKEILKGIVKTPTDIVGLLILASLISFSSFSQDFVPIVKEETFKTHLRWNIFVAKNLFVLEKENNKNVVYFKSLDENTLNQIKQSLDTFIKSDFKSKYIKDIKYLPMGPENLSASLMITLAEVGIDVFHFYRENEGKFIVDFWKNNDKSTEKANEKKDLDKKISDIEKYSPEIKVDSEESKSVKITKEKMNVTPKKVQELEHSPAVVKNNTSMIFSAEDAVQTNKDYRDFRYGANFVWDYMPLGPSFKGFLNTGSKTAEVFYPIKNRPYQNDEQEAHLQLAINFYKKEKWGLMYKSLKLFQKKYGTSKSFDLIEYLKANALLRENIIKGETEPVKMAVQMYASLAEKTKEYELQLALLKYLITYYIDKKDYVSALNFSKKLYVKSKENFDYEDATLAAESILFNLANLSQVEKIIEITNDKTILKIIPLQNILAYQFYTTMARGDTSQVIKLFEKHQKSLARPVHEVILFNTAESYFRQARFEEAIKLFDEFLAHYSFNYKAEEARLRIALSYEILEKDPKEIADLYLNSINRSSDIKVSYEAKLRYVAFTNIRKKESSPEEIERRFFLNMKEGEEKKLNKKIIHLLWLVRLRLLIVDKKYDEALSYLNAVHMVNLLPAERRVFEADGAEIIYGEILAEYQKGHYPSAVKIWETYRTKYIDKVANDPYLNFIIGKSYAKLSLFDGLEKHYSSFKRLVDSPIKTYPIWLTRDKKVTSDETLVELDILKSLYLKNWDLAKRAVEDLDKMNPLNIKIDYYRALIEYRNKNFKESIKYFENFISRKKENDLIDPEEVAELIHSYADAVYSINDIERFKKIAEALILDTDKYKKIASIEKYRERIYYLYLETLASEEKPENNLILESKIKNFFDNFDKSIYKDRITFLLGVAYVANKKEDEGRKVLQDLIKNKETSQTIKEMAKSELSLIDIKNRTI